MALPPQGRSLVMMTPFSYVGRHLPCVALSAGPTPGDRTTPHAARTTSIGSSRRVMTETPVTYAASEGVAWITLDRPQVLNALDTTLAATLADHVDRAAADPEITLVIVRGAGRAFCSGMDRTALAADEARAIGLVNWVCAPDGVDAALGDIIDKVRQAAPTASAHAKRLLHASFHEDPRTMIEEVMRAQNDCMASWEVDEANRAWQEKREAVFHPRQR